MGPAVGVRREAVFELPGLLDLGLLGLRGAEEILR